MPSYSGALLQHRGSGWRDPAAVALVLGAIILIGLGARPMLAPLAPGQQSEISLDPAALPMYALRTVTRMLLALAASLLFTFIYAPAAAKSRRLESVLIPLLDVLQSVPVLGYLSFTVLFFLALAPGSALGPELAVVFALFTSQAWNMAFSFYQALKTIPEDLGDACRSFRCSAWRRFWVLEVPFAMPGLVWNMMMSMSGGWFFVVASEAISVGKVQIALPGVGSYVARAIRERDVGAVCWSIVVMTCAILIYDQLLFRPLVAWAEKFRFEQTAATVPARSWLLELLRQSKWLGAAFAPASRRLSRATHWRLQAPWRALRMGARARRRIADLAWYAALAATALAVAQALGHVNPGALSSSDVQEAIGDGALTLLRVAALIAIASIVWVPLGVAIGLRPRLTAALQPAAQFLAAFPANLLFPVAVFLVSRYSLEPKVWLSPLMILGTQWYILFNVIAGASAFPTDLREAASSFRVRSWTWWRKVMLPGIFPFFVTGAITASGGAWNASIVSEAVSWGDSHLDASGLGSYIARMTEAGDFPRIALGVAVMSALVVATNRLLWRPLYRYAERRTRLD